MNDEKLIEQVRNYPSLYDLSNPKYMDTDFKNTLWSKIGEEIKTTGKKIRNTSIFVFIILLYLSIL